jgi:N-formylglutamate deformylase
MFDLRGTPGPVIATAIHDGHELRPEVAALQAITAAERRREEDPFTGRLTTIGDLGLVARRSRFEFDLNRPRERAVYREPEDAWGLHVWAEPPPDAVCERSLLLYDRAHAVVSALVEAALSLVPAVLVLDLHSFNHRRAGPDDAGDPAKPLVNVGTNWIDRRRWEAPVDAFLGSLREATFGGAPIEPIENGPFGGGWLSQRLSEAYGDRVLVLAVELRKSFMDEWTGELDEARLAELHTACAGAADAARQAMR